MNIEQSICQNALQLLVNQNDPALFDNPEVFADNLKKNGASDSEELTALKQSLIERVPWEVRKQSKNLTSTVIKELANAFAYKSKVNIELAIWAIDTWIAVLGLNKLTTSTTSSPNIENSKIVDNLSNNTVSANTINSQPKEEPKVHTIDAVPFDKIKGRLGIVFGEDSTGEIKVFNTWHKEMSSEESSSLQVTPVKLEIATPKPFHTAPTKKKEKFVNSNNSKQKPQQQNNNSQSETNVASQNLNQETSNTQSSSEYKPSVIEQKAYDLINKGTLYVNDALKILAPIAVSGSVLACRKIGEIYYRGFGVVQNFQAAHAWLKLSAEKDDPESLFMMGTMYQFGMGVKQDMVTAKQFFERAAKQGHSKSIESLKIIQMGL